MIMIITITLKGASRDFYDLLTALQTVSNTYPQVARVQSSANHLQHIERLLSHVVCHLVQRDSSATKCDRVEIALILALFYWLKPLTVVSSYLHETKIRLCSHSHQLQITQDSICAVVVIGLIITLWQHILWRCEQIICTNSCGL